MNDAIKLQLALSTFHMVVAEPPFSYTPYASVPDVMEVSEVAYQLTHQGKLELVTALVNQVREKS